VTVVISRGRDSVGISLIKQVFSELLSCGILMGRTRCHRGVVLILLCPHWNVGFLVSPNERYQSSMPH